MVYYKIVNFDHTEVGLTSKGCRISPAVKWCYQNLSNCTVRQRTTSRDVALKFVTGTCRDTCRDTHRHVQNELYTKVALAKNEAKPSPTKLSYGLGGA